MIVVNICFAIIAVVFAAATAYAIAYAIRHFGPGQRLFESFVGVVCAVAVAFALVCIVLISFSGTVRHEHAISELNKYGEQLEEIAERGAPLDTFEEELLERYDRARHTYEDGLANGDEFWYRDAGEYPRYLRSGADTLIVEVNP